MEAEEAESVASEMSAISEKSVVHNVAATEENSRKRLFLNFF